MDSKLKGSFWTDERIENLTGPRKLALAWLITNPSIDLLGFTHITPRRFQFETDYPIAELEGACKEVPSSFQALPSNYYFCRNFLRHQFGSGGEVSLRNNVIKSAIQKAKTLPSPLQGAFLAAYPELRKYIIEAPSEAAAAEGGPKGPEQSRAEQHRAEQSRILGKGGPEEKPPHSEEPAGDIAAQAMALVNATPKPSPTGPTLAAAKRCIARHAHTIPFADILTQLQTITATIRADWTPSEKLQFIPANWPKFFDEDLWRRHPDEWRSKQKPRNKRAKVETGGREFEVLDLRHLRNQAQA